MVSPLENSLAGVVVFSGDVELVGAALSRQPGAQVQSEIAPARASKATPPIVVQLESQSDLMSSILLLGLLAGLLSDSLVSYRYG